MEDRKVIEAQFHDQRERDKVQMSEEEFQGHYANLRFYTVVRTSRAYANNWMKRHGGGVALDYCCGEGELCLELARHNEMVHGIDISAESLRAAEAAARTAGFADRTVFKIMDAEATEFADDTFDVIVCSGVLHHLDLDRAYAELARILKPSGRILCIEALNHNPLIRAYRRRTPHLRTAWEVDHILTLSDIERGRRWFDKVDARFFHMAVVLAVPFRNTRVFAPLLTWLEVVDAVLTRVPGLRRWAWQVVFELSRPCT